jgi:photosystem II stability/assembly factor-like uncharacterized protein
LAALLFACGSSPTEDPSTGASGGDDVMNGGAGSPFGSGQGGGAATGSNDQGGTPTTSRAGGPSTGGSAGGGGGSGAGGAAHAGMGDASVSGTGGAGGHAPGPSTCPSGSLALQPGVWTNITPAAIDASKSACTDLQFDPQDPCTLLALYGGGGLWKSTDAGATWAEIGNLPMPNSLGRILIDPGDSKHIYATGSVNGSSLGFWVSKDGGQTFAIPDAFKAGMAAGKWTNDVYNMSADPTDFQHVVLTLHFTPGPSAPILETTDGGMSFVAHDAAAGMDHAQGLAILFDPALKVGNAKTWLVGAGYGSGIFRTTDAGASWTKVSDEQQNHGGFDVHYSAQGFLHVGVTGGIIRSTDNGVTWTKETNGVPYAYYYSVIGDGHMLYTSQAFVGVDYNQTFITTPEGGPDEGKTWMPFGTQKLPSGPWKMVFDAGNGILYNASWGPAWALKVAR